MRGSSYDTTLLLLSRHIHPQLWPTGAFAVWLESLLFANLKFHRFEAEHTGFIQLHYNALLQSDSGVIVIHHLQSGVISLR